MMWKYFPDILENQLRRNTLDKIDQIREIHSSDDDGYCLGCGDNNDYSATEWPCQTRTICDEGTDFEETRHIVDLKRNDWTIMHPVSCRPNLFDCTQPGVPNGKYTLGKYYCGSTPEGKFQLQEKYP